MSISKLIGAFGIVGAVLMIVCVFLEWGSVELTVLSTGKFTFNGLGLYTDATVYDGIPSIKISNLGVGNYSYAPIVVLISGIIGIVATVIPMFVKNEAASRGLGIIALILAVVSIVLMVLCIGDLSDKSGFYDILFKYAVNASYGAYIGIVGALLMVVGGIADIAKKNC